MSDQSKCRRRRECEEWLKEFLGSGQQLASVVRESARKVGHSPRTLDRAKLNLKVKSQKEGNFADAKWYWVLPEPPEETQPREERQPF